MTKLNIEMIYGAFSTAGGAKRFDFPNLYQDPQGLTGSESNCFLYAKALAKRGHTLTLYTYLQTPSPLTWEGLTVRNIDDYHSCRTPPDVQIAWNEPNYLFSAANCSLHVCHQQLNDFGYCHPNFEDVVDLFCSPSQSHLEFIRQETPKSHHKWHVISNCVDLDLFKPETPKITGRIIFASSPDRALHLLLSVYPKIKKAVKNANLRIMYDFYSWYNRVKEVSAESTLDWHETSKRANYIKSALDSMKTGYDITHLNAVSRNQVAKEMNEAVVLAYPVSTIRWSEGFSVVAAESCAAGVIPILSDCDALGSIYGSVCPMIRGPVAKQLNQFSELVIQALTDETFQKDVRAKTVPFAQQFNFDQWAEKFESLMVEKCQELKRGPFYQVVSITSEASTLTKQAEINPESIKYWDHCLYENGGFFDQNTTTEILNTDLALLKRYAEHAYQKRKNSPYGENSYEELESLPLNGMRVLEFGCGAGIDSLHMAQMGAKVVSCDIVPSNVQVVQKLLQDYPECEAKLITSYDDLDSLGEFDLVYSHGVLHHIQPEQIGGVIEKLIGCVKPGGNLLMMVYTKSLYPVENYTPEGPYARGYTEQELANLIGDRLQCLKTRIYMSGGFMWGLFQKSTDKATTASLASKRPKVSVLVSTFRPGGIDITLAGMRDQTFKDFELIIADRRYEKRHKEVMKLAKEYGIKCIHVPEHRTNGHWTTFCSAWNTAIALSRGEHIIFLADWTYAPPGWIEGHLAGHQHADNRFVIARYIYTEMPEIKWIKKPENFDQISEMQSAYNCTTLNDTLYDGVVNELSAFSDGLFDASWIPKLRPSEYPDQDIRHIILSTPGSVVESFVHIKNESALSRRIKDLNGLDERMERGKGPMDLELSSRMNLAGMQLWWDPNIPHCISPNPRWYFRSMAWGSMKDRHQNRWSYEDGFTYIQLRENEIKSSILRAEQQNRLKAKNKRSILELGTELDAWRDEANHPIKLNDTSDIEHWGQEIWPTTP